MNILWIQTKSKLNSDTLVTMIVDGGWGLSALSTVIDCSRGDDDVEIVREGLGSLDIL
jgi:hypothetical protein